MTDFEHVIVGGCPRSGTTGFLDCMNRSEAIAIIPEYNLLRMYQALDVLFLKSRVNKKKSWVGDINRQHRDGEVLVGKFAKFIPQPEVCLRPLVALLFSQTFDKKPSIIGDKYPFYWHLDLDTLRSLSGETLKIIHISRNPLSIINSYHHRMMLKRKGLDIWPYNNKWDPLIHWCESWSALCQGMNRKSSDFLSVKYEDLLGVNSNTYWKNVGEFLGVEDPSVFAVIVDQMNGSIEAEQAPPSVPAIFIELSRDWNSMSLEMCLKKYPPRSLYVAVALKMIQQGSILSLIRSFAWRPLRSWLRRKITLRVVDLRNVVVFDRFD